jgi:hypothetical protein
MPCLVQMSLFNFEHLLKKPGAPGAHTSRSLRCVGSHYTPATNYFPGT